MKSKNQRTEEGLRKWEEPGKEAVLVCRLGEKFYGLFGQVGRACS